TETGTTSWAMRLQKRADLPVEHVGTLEVRRMAGGFDAHEARARNVLVYLLGQLGPDEAVLVAGQEHGRDTGGRISIYGRGEAAELLAELRGERRVEAGDLRIEERADGLRLAKRSAEGRVPQHGRSRRARCGKLLAHGADVLIGEVADGVRHGDRPESLGPAHGRAYRR